MRRIAALALAGLALPAAASAQPNRYQLEATIQPGDRATLTIGTVPKGEFAFAIRAGSDDAKAFTVTQQRNGGVKFPVFVSPGPATNFCDAAAGTLFCRGITTPATPGGRTWTFRVKNKGTRPLTVTLTIVWKAVVAG